MTGKIFQSTLLVAVLLLLCAVTVICGVTYRHLDDILSAQLQDELILAAAGTELQGSDYLQRLEKGHSRLTWVAPDGTVLFDSHAQAAAMEDHLSREEIREALGSGSGSAVRYSDTLMEKTIYEARRLSDGTVLRISISNSGTAILFLGLLHPVCIILFLAIVLCALLSHRIARRIVEPLNSLDLDHPLQNDAYPELEPMLRKLSSLHAQTAAQLRSLRWKTEEFQKITDNMAEALILLDGKGMILSINPAAKALFGAGDLSIGKYFLTLDRSEQMRQALDGAFGDGSAHFIYTREDRSYRFSLNRIDSDGTAIGAVVLAWDVTQQLQAQQQRQEFSANVSHELKTPLHSIMGSAELLEQGLVKPEDSSRFAGLIRGEAKRLLDLVEDIIRLSQMDEGAALPLEETDLFSIAREAAAALAPLAKEKDVTLTVTGEGCPMRGVPRLLREILFNLADNAIKYNIPNGKVTIDCRPEKGHVILTVSDTGIGIPQAHQSRIFERFYRVDKSHSRSSGGTGLGLSIVKHGAQLHDAVPEISSAPGKGTTVVIRFPRKEQPPFYTDLT